MVLYRMKKQEFQQLFEDTIKSAILYAEQLLERKIPQEVSFQLHGAGYSGKIVDFAQVMDAIYLGEEQFFRFITVGVVEVRRNETILFVGISGHTPTSFEKIRNTPPGNGPFNPVIPLHVNVID
mgnify:CR=1 FL=1